MQASINQQLNSICKEKVMISYALKHYYLGDIQDIHLSYLYIVGKKAVWNNFWQLIYTLIKISIKERQVPKAQIWYITDIVYHMKTKTGKDKHYEFCCIPVATYNAT